MRRGLTLIELLLASTMAALAFFTFITVFKTSYQNATMTRNRSVAIILARSLMDEIESHPYGLAAPESWKQSVETPAHIVVQGKLVDLTMRKEITYLNSSFIGRGQEDSDVVTVTLTWEENEGDGQAPNRPVQSQRKSLSVSLPVWR